MSDYKECRWCGVTKALSEFYRQASTTDGRQSYCAECSRSYSQRHYQNKSAFRKAQREVEKEQQAREKRRRCSYVNCDAQRHDDTYCLTHFAQLPARPCFECGSLTKHPDGWCLHCRVDIGPRSDGYVRVSWQGRMVGLHRIVMQEALGRPLFRDENVHHINGDRADNRLENLELWSTSQPAGQRVEDKVEWAQMILTRYGHLESTQAT